MNQHGFLHGSKFLADLNNVKDKKKPEYKSALLGLKNLVLVKWSNDTSIVPKESSHFGFYNIGQDRTTHSLQEMELYKEDWLGLKVLQEEGKLHFKTMQGDHMDFDWDWITANIVEAFLGT